MGATPSARRQGALRRSIPSQPEENLKGGADSAIREPEIARRSYASAGPIIDFMIRSDLRRLQAEIRTVDGFPGGRDKGWRPA
jgi:hypothetical protein